MMNSKANMNNEQRKLTRVSIPDHPQVYDAHSGAAIGQLVNLSIEGLMIMSPNAVQPGTLLQLRIPLQCNNEVVEVLLGAESLWCDETDTSGVCWTGLHIIDIAPEHHDIISSLVYD